MNCAIFLFLWSVLMVTKTFGQLDYLDVDLQQDVENPTVAASCDEIGAFKKRSVKRDSNQSASVTEPGFDEESYIFEDDCVVYSDTCPSQIKISWLQASPFVYRPSGNQTENVTTMKGILSDTFTRTISVCCRKFAGTIPRIIYLNRSPSLKALQKELFDGKADAIIPVHSNEGTAYGGDLPYVEILESPGVVLITKHSPSAIERGFLVWNAVRETWPVALIAFLMSSVAGVFVWVLDTPVNPDHFPRKFYRGAFEGFWWAYVTITTVGYGDKTPKSTLARLFAVLWIMIGVTVCSIITATLSSALTNVKMVNYDVTTGKRIGVLRDSVALQDAVNLAANITILDDPDEIYNTLANGSAIHGILEELFTGIEQLKMKDRSKHLSVSKFIWHKRAHGVAYRNYLFTERVAGCISNVIKFRSNDVLKITSNYLRAAEGATSDVDDDVVNVYDSQSPVFIGCVTALSVFLFVVLTGGRCGLFVIKHISLSKRTSETKITNDNGSSSKAFINQELESSLRFAGRHNRQLETEA